MSSGEPDIIRPESSGRLNYEAPVADGGRGFVAPGWRCGNEGLIDPNPANCSMLWTIPLTVPRSPQMQDRHAEKRSPGERR